MTVVDLIAFIRRNWRTLVVAVLVGALAMAAFSFLTPKVYESSSAGFVIAASDGSSADAISGSQTAVTRANAYLPLISSSAVSERIEADPEANPGGEALSGRLTARVAPGSTLIEVTAAAGTAQNAAALANGALAALAAVITDIETQSTADRTPQITVVPLENAEPPAAPTSPDWVRNILLGALGGLVLGFGLAFLRRALDIRVRTVDDLTELFGVGVLGRIPKAGRPGRTGGRRGTDALTAEAFRSLRTGLRFSSVDEETRSVVITSANQAEGKSTIAAGLARVTAESGQRTLLVDADLRRPSVARMLDIDGAIGLSEVLSHQIPADDAIRPTGTAGLYALPAGHIPPNPSEMLGSEAMRALVARLSKDYFVVIDAPPVLPVTDASIVATVVDGVVFVVASNQTRRPEVVAARRIVQQVRARVLGTVLNMVTARDGDTGYYYYDRKNAYYAEPQPATGRKRAAAAPRRSELAPVESRALPPQTSRRAAR
ncbi:MULTISPECIES: polysaccharide biosynthesis tyrosine autokinase [unclassified Rathayibacter]|uniref:polysaccharide biosynthesis tyrosine autokinase n=1 Tax=unclassified Rathayibacter TaxID=2609250 RepID=UPI000CE8604F|nr:MULTISPECIES: polysaccharide biosynthesis tyrosine autokinase [unclassified Rathayibacter]PPH73227.1 chain length determinant protein [Rathayibacter sp. AY1D4]PPH87072.1 chain length determinant protein [Rathayibacter sp. AY1D3]